MSTTDDKLEVVHGSGNIFADLNLPDPQVMLLRAMLASEIIKTLDSERLTVREAEVRTGIAAADFSRIRRARLDRFTVDRLMRILDRLNREVHIKLSVSRRKPGDTGPRLAA